MQQKFSLIQEKINNDNIISNFRNEIIALNEKYDIEQETFGIASNGMTAVPSRIYEGYMTVTGEYDTLEEALKNFRSLYDVLYIVDSGQFIVGKYSNVISENKEDKKIVDLSTLKFI